MAISSLQNDRFLFLVVAGKGLLVVNVQGRAILRAGQSLIFANLFLKKSFPKQFCLLNFKIFLLPLIYHPVLQCTLYTCT